MTRSKLLRLSVAQNDNAIPKGSTILEEALISKRIDVAALVNAMSSKKYGEINEILLDILEDAIKQGSDIIPQIIYRIARNVCDDRFCKTKIPAHKDTAAQILMCRAVEKQDKFTIGQLLTHFDREVRSGAILFLMGQITAGRANREKIGLIREVLGDFGFLKRTIEEACKPNRISRTETQRAQFYIMTKFVTDRYRNPYEKEISSASAINSSEIQDSV